MARKGLFSYYRQFEGMSEREVNAQLKEAADERRQKALSRVEPLDLTQTTWPEVPHPAIVGAITFAARRGLHRYVDRAAGELRSEVAHRHGVPEDRVAVGDGAAQLLSSAITALMEPGDELVTPWPSYPLYPLAARRARGVAVPVAGHDVDAVLAAVNDRTRVVCLCNPNDPTGELVGVGDLARLARALPERVVLLVDEALRDHVDAEPADATLPLLGEHPRILLFRTFSKAWGLAGLRCGYALGGPGAEELLDQLMPELGVDELAQAGCTEALRHHADLPARRRDRLAPLRARLLEELRARELDVAPSQANVVWLAPPGGDDAGVAVATALDRQGVRVGSGAQLGAPDRLRLVVPVREPDLERLLRALDVALGRAA
ncbi:histidinol-phosphate transaminase [Conexibacter sp. SYSU D00693]|uniref:pyridoxal phosphate-dependent aminotransferase n=1 Tax=Conexibacter sp. SYSU D00693 TaxID=2812560 RepID=UPI00196ABFC4|nr:aminotransferase class I/II-fold pyridoxal phosphate-dependent enzyme [Conexibacter sp. SYSU D00693]